MKVASNRTDAARQLHLELEELIDAPRERVFAAMIDEISEWFPHRFVAGSRMRTEPGMMGTTVEEWGSGKQGVVQAVTTAYRKPDLAAMVAFGGMLGNWFGQWVYRFETTETGTLVRLSIYVMGDISDELSDMYLNGWPGLFEAVKEYLSAKS